MTVSIAVIGDVDPRAVDQLRTCTEHGGATRGALCADAHVGYSMPIGGVVAYPDHISPSGVGYDIACGNKAVRTNINAVDSMDPNTVSGLMDEIAKKISFGMGLSNPVPVESDVLDRIRDAEFAPQRQLYDLAAKQLGTVGAGNHYVDLFHGDDDMVWVGVHFGSRGFGHKTASGFLAMAAGGRFEDRGSDGEMFSPPVLLDVNEEIGQAYLSAMHLAGDYAYAGRDAVVAKVLGILGAEATYEVHNHHNFAWREHHDGQDVWVVRKGATPAFPGQAGFVGATMGEDSVILEGRGDPEMISPLLWSTVHGAGRVMSRTAAAGKKRKRWTCNNRDCDYVQGPGEASPITKRTDGNRGLHGSCPACGNSRLSKRWVQETSGAIDWDATLQDLADKQIELRGAAADEAPGAYKRLEDVLDYHEDSVRILHHLTPIGVAMAGPDIEDAYKD